jgi:hypothetical protein
MTKEFGKCIIFFTFLILMGLELYHCQLYPFGPKILIFHPNPFKVINLYDSLPGSTRNNIFWFFFG